jgi:membrane-bound lytic murein transglycosylase D
VRILRAGAEADAALFDSVLAETDLLLDSLSVPIDSLSGPTTLSADLPDLSDSLAAATEARLPSVDELFDYPVVVNRRVLAWIDQYSGRGKTSFNRSLKRSGRYLAMARRIFAEEGVPQDLTFLAHVESAFRFNARSHKRALGLWQFMRGTARIYGLRCDSYIDERLDPEKETRAAARYLKDLHERYDDWYLALAAYNTGAGRVDRAIRRLGTRDFWEIARTRFLLNETRNFVPAILAVTILAKSPGAYGLSEEADPPIEYDTVTVDSPTDLRVVAQCTRTPLAELQELNPALLLNQTPAKPPAYDIHVPKGMGETFARTFAEIPPDQRLVYHQHKVRRGQTLGLLAQRYGTTVRAIQDANGMGRRTMIRIGQTLKIPSRHGGGLAYLDRENAVEHVVCSGEYLGRIAQTYGVSVGTIAEANGLANPRLIYPGQVLRIPPATDGRRRARQDAARDAAGDLAVSVSKPAGTGPAQSPATEVITQHARNTSDSLGRVPTTAHIVAQAREAIKREKETAANLPPPRVHVVRWGDTLSEIAERYHIRLSDLRQWNALGRRSIIHPGQELVVTDPGSGRAFAADGGEAGRLHTVRRGESLWKIAKRYRVRVSDLTQWNNLNRTATIYPGQKLRVY